MKSVLLLAAVTAAAAGLCDLCGPGAARATEAPVTLARAAAGAVVAPAPAVDTVTLHVEGMTCGGCAIATRRVLERLDGVTRADVSYEEKRAVVTYDPAKVTVAQMIAAVATLKYTARVVVPVQKS